jgi:hypothetical protein
LSESEFTEFNDLPNSVNLKIPSPLLVLSPTSSAHVLFGFHNVASGFVGDNTNKGENLLTNL